MHNKNAWRTRKWKADKENKKDMIFNMDASLRTSQIFLIFINNSYLQRAHPRFRCLRWRHREAKPKLKLKNVGGLCSAGFLLLLIILLPRRSAFFLSLSTFSFCLLDFGSLSLCIAELLIT